MSERSREDECMLILLPLLVKFWGKQEYEIEMVPFFKAIESHLSNLRKIGRFADLPNDELLKCLASLEKSHLISIEKRSGANLIELPAASGHEMHKKLYEELKFLVSE